jgi:ribosomal protein L11 methylase PrmA
MMKEDDNNDYEVDQPSQQRQLSPLPRLTHPTAKAFFDELDNRRKKSTTSKTSSLRKTIQSVGWRNRFSQDTYYPIEIEIDDNDNNKTTTTTTTTSTTTVRVQQFQCGEIDGTYGTGATVWPAAIVLIKYLETTGIIKNKLVVDLGSGTGITSIASVKLGGSRVICTDGIDSVVGLAKRNVEMNLQGKNDEKIRVEKYWWGTDEAPKFDVDGVEKAADIVIVADCVLPKLYPIGPLVQAIDECLTTNASREEKDEQQPMAILSYEHRYYPEYDPRTKFRELAGERNLIVKTIPLQEQHPIYSVDDIEIWIVTRKNK